jgi:hypothetical protein
MSIGPESTHLYTIDQLRRIVLDNPGSMSDSNSLPWYEYASEGKYRLLNPGDYPINRYQGGVVPVIPRIPMPSIPSLPPKSIPSLPRKSTPSLPKVPRLPDTSLVGPVQIPPNLSSGPRPEVYSPPAPSRPPAVPSQSNFYYY